MVAIMDRPTGKLAAYALGLCALLASGSAIGTPLDLDSGGGAPGTSENAPYLQCVPYARQVTGIELFGDAHTWWDQAAGRYRRGHEPRVGAVMSFHPYGSMVLGHVAAVSRVIDSRTVLLRHANWSPINGRRGQIENNVRAIDVSPDNDWSEVRVWFAPLQALGTTRWPVNGFIYPQKARGGFDDGVTPAKVRRPVPRVIDPRLDADQIIVDQSQGDDFTTTFAAYTPRAKDRPLAARSLAVPARSRIGANFLAGIAAVPAAKAKPRAIVTYAARADDPIGRIIAARMR
jgi:surface antigen